MIEPRDRQILRDLARQVADVACLPVMEQRRNRWKRHNSLGTGRPMILIFPEGSWGELIPGDALRCEGPEARGMEFELRHRLYTFHHFASDNVVEAEWIVSKAIRDTGWGLQARHRPSTAARGAWAFDPVITSPGDMDKIRLPEVTHDSDETARRLESAQDLFGDILNIRVKGIAHISFHLMALYTGWRGLEQVMLDMLDEPQWLHDAMARLEEGHHGLVRQYEEQSLFSLNNDGTYHSSGGVGYTDELPAPGFDTGHVRPRDMWSSAEAQEMAQVSPEMHAEFILPYEKRLLAPFGLNGYGCCEDLAAKLDDVLSIPNIRRISISPFADVEKCARLQGSCIFSWKPQPAHLVGQFDPDMIEAYLQHALQATKGCVLEIILKDTHTCQNQPERFDRWTQIARRLVDDSPDV
jgi:hypothetical protein